MKDKKYVAISAIWFERFLECSRCHGTENFVSSVWRFYHSLLNLGEGELAIKDIVKEYLEKVWNPNFVKIFNAEYENAHSSTSGIRSFIYSSVEQGLIVDLFEFITQTIQSSGIGWQTYLFGDAESSDINEAMQRVQN